MKNNSRTEHLGATLLLLLIYIFPAFASVIFSITHTEPLFLCKFSWHWCVRKRYSNGPINHYQFDNFLQSKETSEVVRYLLSVGNLDMKHDTSFHSSLSWIIIIISQLVSLRCDQSILLVFRYFKLLIWYMLELCFFTWMWRLIDVVGLILVLFLMWMPWILQTGTCTIATMILWSCTEFESIYPYLTKWFPTKYLSYKAIYHNVFLVMFDKQCHSRETNITTLCSCHACMPPVVIHRQTFLLPFIFSLSLLKLS